MPADAEPYDWDAARARLAAAADAVGEAPPAWIPAAPGEEIVGRLVAVNPSAYTAHGNVPVVTLEGPHGGRRSVWLHHAVLRRGFERENVQLGELVLVRYVGKVQPEAGGNPWHDYRVAVDRASSNGGGPDWHAIAVEHEDAAELEHERAAAAAAPASDAPLGPSSSSTPADDDIPF